MCVCVYVCVCVCVCACVSGWVRGMRGVWCDVCYACILIICVVCVRCVNIVNLWFGELGGGLMYVLMPLNMLSMGLMWGGLRHLNGWVKRL